MPLHANVYAVAENYGISELKACALRNLNDTIHDNPERTIDANFQEALQIAYTTTIDADKSMRDAFVIAIRNNEKCLDDEFPGIPPRPF